MKILLAIVTLLAVQAGTASEFQPVAAVYQNAQGEKLYVPIAGDVKECIQTCIDLNDRPSAELKACIARCQK